MFPKEGVPTCPKCGLKQEGGKKEGGVVTKCKAEREVVVQDELSGTLPTADEECPKCGNKKAYWVLRQMRGADEPETRIFRCTKCSHSWRESA
jgi:DNA-directed RNA polymerase subunit M